MAVDMIRNTLRMTKVKETPQLQVFIEEDFLVPDVKPDMMRIISVNGKAKLGEKENFGGSLRVNGDLILSILYVPSGEENEFPLEVMETRTVFRHDEEIAVTDAELEVVPKVEHLEFSVVNERKLRAKAIISLTIREYQTIEKNMFSGFREEELELLKGKIQFTDVAERHKDYIEVKEEVQIGEGRPEIGRILKTDFTVGETYRQISTEKAIISGAIYFNLLYLSNEMEPMPVFFQGQTDFTQFLRLENGDDLVGSDVVMTVEDVRVFPKADEDENMTLFDLTVGISTRMDTFRDQTVEIIEDAYHSKKAIDIEQEEMECCLRRGSGIAEAAIKETVGLPNGAEAIHEVIYVSGEAFAAGGEIEKGRAIIEGVLEAQLIYSSDEHSGNIRSFTEEIPFRTMVEIPGLEEGMEIHADFFVKRLGVEKTSDRQLEVFGDIVVIVTAQESLECSLVKSAAIYDDLQIRDENETRAVLYVVRPGDRMWDVGKRFKTPAAEIRMVNGLAETEEPVAGRKMLIWS